MIRFFRDLYLTFFTVGFRARAPQELGGGWGPIVDAGKGVVVVCLIELLILKGLTSCIKAVVGTGLFFDSSEWKILATSLALYVLNYYMLVKCGYGIKFEREFTDLKRSRKFLLLASCAMLFLGSIAFAIYSDSVWLNRRQPI
jgi:hypothetical protein